VLLQQQQWAYRRMNKETDSERLSCILTGSGLSQRFFLMSRVLLFHEAWRISLSFRLSLSFLLISPHIHLLPPSKVAAGWLHYRRRPNRCRHCPKGFAFRLEMTDVAAYARLQLFTRSEFRRFIFSCLQCLRTIGPCTISYFPLACWNAT